MIMTIDQEEEEMEVSERQGLNRNISVKQMIMSMTRMQISMRVQTKILVRLAKSMILKRKRIKKIREELVITIIVMEDDLVETKLRNKHMLDKVHTHLIKKALRKRKQF